jgi:hypothetical protein
MHVIMKQRDAGVLVYPPMLNSGYRASVPTHMI